MIIIIVSLIIISASAVFTFRNNKNLRFFIFVSSLSITLICTFYHYYLKNIESVDALLSHKNTIIDLLSLNAGADSDKVQITQMVNEIIDLLVPFVYFLDAFIYSLIGFYIIRYFINRNNKTTNNKAGKEQILSEGIERFKVTDYLIFLFIAAWSVVLLVDRSMNYYLYMAGLNISLMLSSFYLIQAFGIIKFLLKKKSIPFTLLPAVILLLLFFGMEYFIFVLIILSSIGAFDFWADFRKLEPDTKKS